MTTGTETESIRHSHSGTNTLAGAACDLAEHGQALRPLRPVEAVSAFTEAIAALESLPADIQDAYGLVLAGCYNELGSALGLSVSIEKRYRPIRAVLPATRSSSRRSRAGSIFALAMALSGLAVICRELLRWDDAIDASTRAIRLYEQISKTTTSSSPDLRLGNELKALHEAEAHVSPESPLPKAAEQTSPAAVAGLLERSISTAQINRHQDSKHHQHDRRRAPCANKSGARPPTVVHLGIEPTWIVGEPLKRGHRSSDVHTLARGYVRPVLYPARDFAHRCLPRRPHLFITYDWEENFVDLQEAIHSGMQHPRKSFAPIALTLRRGQLQTLWDKVGIWIDFLFIDQSARTFSMRSTPSCRRR